MDIHEQILFEVTDKPDTALSEITITHEISTSVNLFNYRYHILFTKDKDFRWYGSRDDVVLDEANQLQEIIYNLTSSEQVQEQLRDVFARILGVSQIKKLYKTRS